MRKFSKILESMDSDMVSDIKDIFIDLIDKGFNIKVNDGQGVYLIELNSSVDLDPIECVNDIYIANKRLLDLGLDYVKSDVISLGRKDVDNYVFSTIILRYNDSNSVKSKDVHGWEEFRLYIENVLGVKGIKGKLDDDSYFRLNILNKDGWSGLPEDMLGWSIGVEGIDPEKFISSYPGYEEFLNKLLNRQINYSLVWHLVGDGDKPENTEHNPLGFNKEGIEVVEKLLEMADKFPDKIEVDRI